MAEKKKMCHFFNSLKVILIRHLNNNEGMYNNYTNIESVEPENKILDLNNGNQYNSGNNVINNNGDGTGLIHNPENYTTLNHSKSINDTFRDKEKERFEDDKKDGLNRNTCIKIYKR